MNDLRTIRYRWLHLAALAWWCLACGQAAAQDVPATAVPDSARPAPAAALSDSLAVSADDTMTVPEPRPASELPDLWSTGASPLAAVLVSPTAFEAAASLGSSFMTGSA